MPSRTPEPVLGDLEATPFAHVLVYALDRRLTGALYLEEPSRVRHTVRFVDGAPVKVRPGDGYARLGELLLEAGIVTDEALQGALSMAGLLGDALILGGHAEHSTVESVVVEQFYRRIVRLFELPRATRFMYIEGDPALENWGGEPSKADPLALLWAGLREYAHLSSKLEHTLSRLGDSCIRIHPDAALDRFGFTAGELAAIDHIRESPRSFADLRSARVVHPDTLRRLIYTLLITRQLGQNALPLGASASADIAPSLGGEASPPPSPVSEEGIGGGTAVQPLARMQLKSISVRVGIAAPDAPGDGEPRTMGPGTRLKK